MRNNVPGGEDGLLVPLAGVEKRAGGPTGRVLIEQLRASIRALEQVPVSLAFPPHRARPLPVPPALYLPPSNDNEERPLGASSKAGSTSSTERLSDTPAALGFALAVITATARTMSRPRFLVPDPHRRARMGAPLWSGSFRSGLDPARLLLVEARTADDAAWALEEGLKSGALLACLAQIPIKPPLPPAALALPRKPPAPPA